MKTSDTWTRRVAAALRAWWCRNCGHVNQEIGDCEKCGR
jgi:hypothetical protein